MERKYPSDAYRGFRASLPDWFIGVPTAGLQERAVRRLQLRPGQCVCDAACGSGFNLRRLVRAVGPDGLVIAVEDNPNLLAKSAGKVRHAGWTNVRLQEELDASQFEHNAIDGIIVSYNPPIFLQRRDLLSAAWAALKPGGRLALVAGRCTTPVGRVVGPGVRVVLRLAGHGSDWRYWLLHEPWNYLAELSAGNLWVAPRWGFQYLLWAEKPKGPAATV